MSKEISKKQQNQLRNLHKRMEIREKVQDFMLGKDPWTIPKIPLWFYYAGKEIVVSRMDKGKMSRIMKCSIDSIATHDSDFYKKREDEYELVSPTIIPKTIKHYVGNFRSHSVVNEGSKSLKTIIGNANVRAIDAPIDATSGEYWEALGKTFPNLAHITGHVTVRDPEAPEDTFQQKIMTGEEFVESLQATKAKTRK